MRKCVGNIELNGKRLDYYVFGSAKAGYGIEITETYMEKADHIVSTSLEKALAMANVLQRGSVFPTNLNEIIEDFEYGNNTD